MRAEIKFDLIIEELLLLRVIEEVCCVEATTTDFTDEMACILSSLLLKESSSSVFCGKWTRLRLGRERYAKFRVLIFFWTNEKGGKRSSCTEKKTNKNTSLETSTGRITRSKRRKLRRNGIIIVNVIISIAQ